MSVLSIGLGQDADVDLVNTTTGVSYSFSTGSNFIGSTLIDFQVDPVNNLITQDVLGNGNYQLHRTERKGWHGTMNCGRLNGLIEKMEIQAHNKSHLGLPEDRYSIHATIRNQDGSSSVSEYEVTNCVLMMSKGANFKSSDPTTITLEFHGDDLVDQDGQPISA